jgi:hypothetical protein
LRHRPARARRPGAVAMQLLSEIARGGQGGVRELCRGRWSGLRCARSSGTSLFGGQATASRHAMASRFTLGWCPEATPAPSEARRTCGLTTLTNWQRLALARSRRTTARNTDWTQNSKAFGCSETSSYGLRLMLAPPRRAPPPRSWRRRSSASPSSSGTRASPHRRPWPTLLSGPAA